MKQMQQLRYVLLVVCCSAGLASARLGETEEQSKQRYGEPVSPRKEKLNVCPLILGAVHHTYLPKGWVIECAFLEGKAVRITYRKMVKEFHDSRITDDDLHSILNGEAAGGTWDQLKAEVPQPPSSEFIHPSGYPLQYAWQHSKGALATDMYPRYFIMVDAPDFPAIIKKMHDAEQARKDAKAAAIAKAAAAVDARMFAEHMEFINSILIRTDEVGAARAPSTSKDQPKR